MDAGFVRCEKLIAVIDPAAPRWWLKTLDVADNAIFAGGGRLEVVAEARAVDAALAARRRGFNPLLLCASPVTRKRLEDGFATKGRVGRFLVQGQDDEQVRWLLLHPSREVLLGWQGTKRLLVPTQAYHAALNDWLAHDPVCQEFLRRVAQQDVRLTDFHLVSEPDVDSTAPCQRYEFQWSIDPSRKLELFLYLTTHKAILTQSVAEAPVHHSVELGSQLLSFDDNGECELDGAALAWLVDQFDLPEAYRYWDDSAYGPGLLDHVRAAVLHWWSAMNDAFSELLTPERWNVLAPLLEPSLAGAHAARREVTEPAQLRKPILRIVEDEPDLQFAVQWHTLNAAAVASLAQEPRVEVTTVPAQQGEPRSVWAQDYRLLTISGVRFPRPYRYAYAWNAEHNLLRIRIEP